MNKYQRFENFLESLKGYDRNDLLESIREGFHACMEAKERTINYDQRFLDDFHKTVTKYGQLDAKGDKAVMMIKPEMARTYVADHTNLDYFLHGVLGLRARVQRSLSKDVINLSVYAAHPETGKPVLLNEFPVHPRDNGFMYTNLKNTEVFEYSEKEKQKRDLAASLKQNKKLNRDYGTLSGYLHTPEEFSKYEEHDVPGVEDMHYIFTTDDHELGNALLKDEFISKIIIGKFKKEQGVDIDPSEIQGLDNYSVVGFDDVSHYSEGSDPSVGFVGGTTAEYNIPLFKVVFDDGEGNAIYFELVGKEKKLATKIPGFSHLYEKVLRSADERVQEVVSKDVEDSYDPY